MYKVVQLYTSKNRDDNSSYDVMSHLVLCVFYYGTLAVKFIFSSKTWKDTTAAEIAGYNFVGLFATVLFFFTSSHIAQQHFVMAKVSVYLNDCEVYYIALDICSCIFILL